MNYVYIIILSDWSRSEKNLTLCIKNLWISFFDRGLRWGRYQNKAIQSAATVRLQTGQTVQTAKRHRCDTMGFGFLYKSYLCKSATANRPTIFTDIMAAFVNSIMKSLAVTIAKCKIQANNRLVNSWSYTKTHSNPRPGELRSRWVFSVNFRPAFGCVVHCESKDLSDFLYNNNGFCTFSLTYFLFS